MGDRINVKLVSTGKQKNGKATGYYVMTTINPRPKLGVQREKLKLRKFDPRAYNKETEKCGMYVTFKEERKLK